MIKDAFNTGLAVVLAAVLLTAAGCHQPESMEDAGNTSAAPAAGDQRPLRILPNLEYSPAPIPNGADALTERERKRRFAKWNFDIWPDSYEKYGDHSTAYDDKARNFVKCYVGYFSGEKYLKRKLIDLARELFGMPCGDPAILYLTGNVLHKLCSALEALPPIEQSLRPLIDSKYPRLFVYFALRRKIWVCRSLGLPISPETVEMKYRYLAKAAADEIFKNGNQRRFLHFIKDELGRCGDIKELELYAVLSREMEKTDAVDPWLLAYVRGKLHIQLAWRERGSGWASEVTPRGWKGFAEHLKKANARLLEAVKLHPEFPEAATSMITLAMAGHSSHCERYWFDKAVKAQFDFPAAYTSYIWSLYPRWGGSHRQMIDFGRECLETKRFDTNVPWYFIYSLKKVNSENGNDFSCFRAPGIPELVEQYIKGSLGSASPENKNWRLSYACALELCCGRDAQAMEYFKKTGGRFRYKALKRLNITPETTAAAREILIELKKKKKRPAR